MKKTRLVGVYEAGQVSENESFGAVLGIYGITEIANQYGWSL